MSDVPIQCSKYRAPWAPMAPKKKNWRLEFGDLVAKIAGDQARRSERRHPSAKLPRRYPARSGSTGADADGS